MACKVKGRCCSTFAGTGYYRAASRQQGTVQKWLSYSILERWINFPVWLPEAFTRNDVS